MARRLCHRRDQAWVPCWPLEPGSEAQNPEPRGMRAGKGRFFVKTGKERTLLGSQDISTVGKRQVFCDGWGSRGQGPLSVLENYPGLLSPAWTQRGCRFKEELKLQKTWKLAMAVSFSNPTVNRDAN